MPLKLSRLQKYILKEAYRRGDGITNRDVLIGYYGFQPDDSAVAEKSGKQIFNPSKIGRAKYNAASVAVVKAFNRLAARGIVRRVYNHGIYLTYAGRHSQSLNPIRRYLQYLVDTLRLCYTISY